MFDDYDDGGGGCGCLLGILLIGAAVSWLEDNITTILIAHSSGKDGNNDKQRIL